MSRSVAENENGAGGTLLAEEATGKQAGKRRRTNVEGGRHCFVFFFFPQIFSVLETIACNKFTLGFN